MRSAALWRRCASALYDSFLVLSIWLLTLFALVVGNAGEAVLGPLVQTILLLEAFVFFAWFWCHGGQTAGMRAWRVHLVSDTGGRITLHQATIRFFISLLALAPLGLGCFWALIDRQGRTWPDIVSGSRILDVPPGQPA